MYSLLPAVVSVLLLAYGPYVLALRGVNRASQSFFVLCMITFVWQFTWAILFQVRDEALAVMLAKLGYLLILFLPTSLYQFVVELTRHASERRAVLLSYACAVLLALALLLSEDVVAGVQRFFFGFYPKAGMLHPLHVLQTALVVTRALYLLYRQQQVALSTERLRLRYCLASLAICFLAAVDYLCNYGVSMYPPGVLFVAIGLGILAHAMARHDLLANPMMLAATIAHEMRTPLATIRNQARGLSKGLPELIAGYEHAVRHGGHASAMQGEHLDYLRELARNIEAEVHRSNFIVDMVLASAKTSTVDTTDFGAHSMQKCVHEALARYPFEEAMRERVTVRSAHDFQFHGSDTLLIYVLYNLLKNALASVAAASRGHIDIAFYPNSNGNHLTVTDTGLGIPKHVLPLVFDPYYTTRHAGGGTGMGLAFCRRVISSFGGTIACRSREGEYTAFTLVFPLLEAEPALNRGACRSDPCAASSYP